MVTPTTKTTPAADVVAAVAAVPDPEIPVVTVEDLGILRETEVDEQARTITVTITPTYSGCPAMEAIDENIRYAAQRCGYTADVRTRLSPAWTTDWMTDEGRERLREFGIAPPTGRVEGKVHLTLRSRQVDCPRCGSHDTEELARFGSTACKALRRCRSCGEPFDEFKAI